MTSVKCGIDQLQIEPKLIDRRLHYGLVTNVSVVDHEGISVLKVLLDLGLTIKVIFSPEHGFDASGQDGSLQPDKWHAPFHIPIISLYGDKLSPSGNDLAHLDALILDLPNIGVRYYTYLWTMMYILESCAASNTPLIILDRPNPLGGEFRLAEGPMMHPDFISFIGGWNIPIRFGLTLGELALLLKKEKEWHQLDLRIIPVTGWDRSMTFSQYHYAFTPPSPAISELKTIYTYPALGYLEATNISEGRGTNTPFQLAIAPWIDASTLISSLEQSEITGVSFEEISLIPYCHKYSQEHCHGLKLHVNESNLYRPVYCGMVLLATIKTLFAKDFKWIPYPTHVNMTGADHFERLTGSTKLKEWLDHAPLDNIDKLPGLLECANWKERCQSIKLYD